MRLIGISMLLEDMAYKTKKRPLLDVLGTFMEDTASKSTKVTKKAPKMPSVKHL